MGQKFAGIAKLKAGGKQWPLRGNFTVSPSATERTGIAGQDGVHGFMEQPRVPFIQCDISLTTDVKTLDFEAMTDVTVTAELANGKTYTLTGAWCKSALELNTQDGQMSIRWEGLDCKESTTASNQ